MKKTIALAAALVCFSSFGFAQGNGKYKKDRPGDRPGTYYRQFPNDRGYDARLPAHDRREAMQINDLQREARIRIGNGIANGTLTTRESIRLLNELDRIGIKERRYLANRELTRRETRELTKDLEKLIRGIQYEKQDYARENNRMAQRQFPRR